MKQGLLLIPERGQRRSKELRPTLVEVQMRGQNVPFRFIYDRVSSILYVDEKWLGWSLFSTAEAEKHALEIAKTTLEAATRAMFRTT